jgi:hypothetical protein
MVDARNMLREYHRGSAYNGEACTRADIFQWRLSENPRPLKLYDRGPAHCNP